MVGVYIRPYTFAKLETMEGLEVDEPFAFGSIMSNMDFIRIFYGQADRKG